MLHIPASRIAACLGLLGLVPFIVPAVCLWLVAPVWQPFFAQMLVGWAAVTLGFHGAVHWGAVMAAGDRPVDMWRYVYGVCPVALGWVALMCPPGNALFLLFLGFVAAFMVDRAAFREHEWYVTLRAGLSAAACLCLYAGYKAL